MKKDKKHSKKENKSKSADAQKEIMTPLINMFEEIAGGLLKTLENSDKKSESNSNSDYDYDNLQEKFREQANKKNGLDCKPILDEINQASLDGEYVKTMQLKVNQVNYLVSLGLKVEETDKFGYYNISWD